MIQKISAAIFGTIITIVAVGSVATGAQAQELSPQALEVINLPHYGDSGDTVIRLQEALIRNGFTLKGGADGEFSARTVATLKAFQRVAGFKATGTLDERTAKFLGLIAPQQIDPTLYPSVGATGDAVWSLQQALINNGIQVKGGADGIFGLATTIAITRFQSVRGLPVTKVLDNATAIALGLTQRKLAPPKVAPQAQAPAPAPAPVLAPEVKPTTPTVLTIDTLPLRGQKSEAVKVVQQSLIANSIEVKGGVDGVFGVATSISIGNFQQARGLNVTSALDLPTAIALGLLPDLATLGIPQISIFPTQGKCSFVDSWHWARSGGRVHEGVDIMGTTGLAIYAVQDGTITKTYPSTSTLSGNAVRLTGPDSTYFFYAHLDSLAPGIQVGTPVRAGQIIGYMGSTGDAGSPHLHFEVHPGGGAAINPFPVVKAVDACHVTDVLPQS